MNFWQLLGRKASQCSFNLNSILSEVETHLICFKKFWCLLKWTDVFFAHFFLSGFWFCFSRFLQSFLYVLAVDYKYHLSWWLPNHMPTPELQICICNYLLDIFTYIPNRLLDLLWQKQNSLYFPSANVHLKNYIPKTWPFFSISPGKPWTKPPSFTSLTLAAPTNWLPLFHLYLSLPQQSIFQTVTRVISLTCKSVR